MKPLIPPPRSWIDLGWASSVGLVLVFCTVIGLVIGLALDRWLSTSPLFTLIFLIIGIISGFWSILKEVLWKNKRNTDEHGLNGFKETD